MCAQTDPRSYIYTHTSYAHTYADPVIGGRKLLQWTDEGGHKFPIAKKSHIVKAYYDKDKQFL